MTLINFKGIHYPLHFVNDDLKLILKFNLIGALNFQVRIVKFSFN